MNKTVQVKNDISTYITSSVVEKSEFENHINDFNTLKSNFYAFTSMYDENLEKQAQLYNQLLTSVKKLKIGVIIIGVATLIALGLSLYLIL